MHLAFKDAHREISEMHSPVSVFWLAGKMHTTAANDTMAAAPDTQPVQKEYNNWLDWVAALGEWEGVKMMMDSAMRMKNFVKPYLDFSLGSPARSPMRGVPALNRVRAHHLHLDNDR